MRGKKAERLGVVQARDAEKATDRAMEEFRLRPSQRRRVLVWRED